jgi:tetratricopeptide (TPR) repeat protein
MTTIDPEIKSVADLRKAAVDAHQKNDEEKALNLYRLYLQNRPKDAAIWSNLGALFRKQKNYELAAATQQRAVELEPDTISLMNNAANAFYDAGYIDKSLKLRKKILLSDPDNKDNYASLGKCYRGLHQLDEAQEILREGINKYPDYAELYIQLAFAELAMGDYPSGFKTFNWRWKGDELSLPDFTFPKWEGEPLKGKTILVTPEQGFGDTVLMARFLSGLKKLGPKIKMVVKPPLQRLFTNLQKDVEFISQISDLNDCDYWVPMMDLPLHLKVTLKKLPKPVELYIPQDSIQRARQLTAPFNDRFKVGVMWSGSVTYRANHKRSFGHQRFLELCDISDLQMFSLYKGPLMDAYVEDGTSSIIVNAAGNDRDFADSAALMQELDLVISMDSAIVHVGGSLGVEVWNLLHSEAYWLYEPFPDHTPWYASMRLIRQKSSGDWDGAFSVLKKDLAKRVKDWKKK